jgi:hypothetical protein
VCGINDPGHTCDEYLVLLAKLGMTITPDEGCAILQDIHVGICGSHVDGRSIMGKAYR